jgi:hypothetical protein
MSTHILSDIRHCTQLSGNTFLVALELAHRLNSQGYGSVSYQFLAWKVHCSKRTAQRQVAALTDTETETRRTARRSAVPILFRKTIIRTKTGNAWNLYHYIGPRLSRAAPPATTQGDTVAPILPPPEREKEQSLRHELENLRKGLRLYGTPGTAHWHATMAKITTLEALCIAPS